MKATDVTIDIASYAYGAIDSDEMLDTRYAKDLDSLTECVINALVYDLTEETGSELYEAVQNAVKKFVQIYK